MPYSSPIGKDDPGIGALNVLRSGILDALVLGAVLGQRGGRCSRSPELPTKVCLRVTFC